MKKITQKPAFVNSKSNKPNTTRSSVAPLLREPVIFPAFHIVFDLDGYPGPHVIEIIPMRTFDGALCSVISGLDNVPDSVRSEVIQQARAFLRAEMAK